MVDQGDLRIAIRQAYADSPVPESLTTTAQGLIDGENSQAGATTPVPPAANLGRAPAGRVPRKRAVLAATLIAAAVAAVAIVATSFTAPRSDRDAAPTAASQPPLATSLPASDTTAARSQTSGAPDMDLLRAKAVGTIVRPDSGAPMDSSSTADEPQWSFTRSRTVAAPIKDVVAW